VQIGVVSREMTSEMRNRGGSIRGRDSTRKTGWSMVLFALALMVAILAEMAYSAAVRSCIVAIERK
jgi:hypothetical protein